MTEASIGGRPVDITKEDGKLKIVFHPIAKGARHPKANMFTLKISKAELDMLKKAF